MTEQVVSVAVVLVVVVGAAVVVVDGAAVAVGAAVVEGASVVVVDGALVLDELVDDDDDVEDGPALASIGAGLAAQPTRVATPTPPKIVRARRRFSRVSTSNARP